MIEILGINERFLVRKEDIIFIRGCEDNYFVYLRCWSFAVDISEAEYFRLFKILIKGE